MKPIPERVQALMDQCQSLAVRIRQYLDLTEKAELRRWEATQKVANLQADHDQVRFQFMWDVETAMEDGKKKYTNKELREIAVSRMLATDEGAQSIAAQIREANQRKFEEDRTCFKLRDELKMYSREHAGVTAMLYVYAAAMGGHDGQE